MGKSQGTPLLAAGGNGPASPAYGSVKPRLDFSLESPLDESGGQAREIKFAADYQAVGFRCVLQSVERLHSF